MVNPKAPFFRDSDAHVNISYCLVPLAQGFPCGSVVKNLPANAGDVGLIPGSGRSSGGENGNSLHYLAWKIPWTEEPGRPQFMRLLKSWI